MTRLPLFELEDQPWFPRIVRAYMQDYLEFMGNLDRSSYKGFVRLLKERMAAMGETRIVDFCSGGAGPVRSILELLRRQEAYPVTATLTDLYPNLAAFTRVRSLSGGQIDFVAAPIDATNAPADLPGFRLLCNSFHHFEPKTARAILADAVTKRRGIAVVEVVSRSVPAFLSLPFGLFLMMLVTPFMQPFRLSRLLLTYVVPVVPLATAFDGVVSCLRTYSVKELEGLTRGLGDGSYQWEAGQVRIGRTPMKLTYLIGSPAAAKLAAAAPLEAFAAGKP